MFVAAGALGGRLSSVLLIRFGTLGTLCFCRRTADLRCPQFADLVLNGSNVDEVLENGLGVLVNVCSVQRTVDEGDGFPAVECQELSGVSFDFCFGDLEDELVNLISMFLWEGEEVVCQ